MRVASATNENSGQAGDQQQGCHGCAPMMLPMFAIAPSTSATDADRRRSARVPDAGRS
jgi:hypothetical protein